MEISRTLPLLPIRILWLLLDIRSLLVRQVGFLALARIWSTPILAIRRPGLLHPQGTIRQGRDHKGAVRPDDAGPTTAQSGLPERIGDARTVRVILPFVFLQQFFCGWLL